MGNNDTSTTSQRPKSLIAMSSPATLPDVWELDDKCGSCGLLLSDHRIGTLQCPDARGCGFAAGTYTEPNEAG